MTLLENPAGRNHTSRGREMLVKVMLVGYPIEAAQNSKEKKNWAVLGNSRGGKGSHRPWSLLLSGTRNPCCKCGDERQVTLYM